MEGEQEIISALIVENFYNGINDEEVERLIALVEERWDRELSRNEAYDLLVFLSEDTYLE